MATEKATGLKADKGIELLTFGTYNGFKASIFLEELKAAYGTEYSAQAIDITPPAFVQKEEWYTKLNVNGRIPTIVDHNKGGYIVMETLAILNYLAKHYDPEHKFHFEDPLEACTAEQWVAWGHAEVGPIQSQANFFYRFLPQRHAFPTQRFVGATERVYGILNTRLADRDYVAGPGRGSYSIADIAIWPYANYVALCGIDLERYPNVLAWWERVNAREAVKSGMKVGGRPMPLGWEAASAMKKNPEVWEKMEAPLRDALQSAQKEFGYVYKSP